MNPDKINNTAVWSLTLGYAVYIVVIVGAFLYRKLYRQPEFFISLNIAYYSSIIWLCLSLVALVGFSYLVVIEPARKFRYPFVALSLISPILWAALLVE